MENSHLKNLSSLILATLFISTSGVLGKYIAMPSEVIIWFRSAFAMLFLYGFCKYKKINLRVVDLKTHVSFIISSLFMAAHWVTYFYALKLSNVALGILSLYTFPIITALLEPFFFKMKFDPVYIALGLLILGGVSFLVPEFNLESTQVKGILFGVFSALCYAIRILILKKHVANYNGTMLMFYQTVIITILLLPILFFISLMTLSTALLVNFL